MSSGKGDSNLSTTPLPGPFDLPLKCEAGSQPDGSSVVNSLVAIALDELSKIRIGIDSSDGQQLSSNGVDIQEEGSKMSKVKGGIWING